MKRTVQVTLLGQELALKTDLPEEQVLKVADFVNAQVDLIRGADRNVDSYRAVVLTLMNVAGLYLHGGGESGDSATAPDDTAPRLENLVERIEGALRDPQGTLNF